MFEFKFETFYLFYLYLCSFGESCLLVLWCAGGRCGMAGNDEDRGRSRRPGAEDRGGLHGSGTRWLCDREVRWRCLWSAPCTWRRGARVSRLSLKTKVDGLSMVWPQNKTTGLVCQWFVLKTTGMVCQWFGFKTTGTVFSGLVSKSVVTVSPVWHQNRWRRILG
jgi:hypothetical protein